MHSALSNQLAATQIADLRRQAKHDEQARATAHVPSGIPQPGRNRLAVRLRRTGRQRRFGEQLWTLLHAEALLDGSAVHPYQR